MSALRADIVEVPITFTDRVRGTSKMSGSIIVESMARITWWGVKVRAQRVRVARREARAARRGRADGASR